MTRKRRIAAKKWREWPGDSGNNQQRIGAVAAIGERIEQIEQRLLATAWNVWRRQQSMSLIDNERSACCGEQQVFRLLRSDFARGDDRRTAFSQSDLFGAVGDGSRESRRSCSRRSKNQTMRSRRVSLLSHYHCVTQLVANRLSKLSDAE
jgi:hypothetical protein